jgi:hypothetical protein
MSKQSKVTANSAAFKEVPTYFADQPAGLAVGPFVSKLTFGVEDGDDSDYPRPVVTIAIPTVALVALLDDLNVIVDGADFKKAIPTLMNAAAERIASGRKKTASKELVEIRSPPKRRATKGRKRLAN